ncbi:hypothetical protein G3N95_12035 [Paraburkholderia sp. Tr-20389]|uniref:hypothetical protein n=1 Tax=Paraburkholderia sp. Tr-20389 TaxID=2703903 RepID=UPI001981E824|nr:hypothetical protein [Paraburkholderia sp. Tr-20389]MBN3753671.1 hypothetical protein [Paraburkholderia sp. Tr-20389]
MAASEPDVNVPRPPRQPETAGRADEGSVQLRRVSPGDPPSSLRHQAPAEEPTWLPRQASPASPVTAPHAQTQVRIGTLEVRLVPPPLAQPAPAAAPAALQPRPAAALARGFSIFGFRQS